MIQKEQLKWDSYWWAAHDQRLPFLANPVAIFLYSHCERDGTSPDPSVWASDRQLQIANSLFELPLTLSDKLDDVAEAFRAETDVAVGLADEGMGHINRANIRQHYRIESIVIPRDCSNDEAVVFLDGECEWEPKHGLRIAVRDGQPIAYSWQSGGISANHIHENFK
ncbi:MAG: hypothetical protein AAF939_19580 [Planctomycetota bacterium]